MKVQSIITTISVALLSGCSSLKPYPICFYDANAPDMNVKVEHGKALLDAIKLEVNEARLTPDSRWVFAKTSWFQHDRIKSSWARVACIGNVTSGTEVKKYQDCINYLNEFLDKENYFELDIKDNTVLSDEAPGKEFVICSREL